MQSLVLALGLFWHAPDAGLPALEGYRVALGHENYVWASTEAPELRFLGQPFGPLRTTGIGIGRRAELGDRFGVAVEFGHYDVDISPLIGVRNEVVHQRLVNDHGTEHPSTPSLNRGGLFFTPDRYKYELTGGFGASIRFDYRVSRHVAITAARRWLSVEERLGMSEGPMELSNPNWWAEQNALDLSATQIGLEYRF